MNVAKAIALLVLTAGLLFFVLQQLAEFSVQQSIWLALILTLIFQQIRGTTRKTDTVFIPYYISVKPNWALLLTDYKLLKNTHEWYSIQDNFTKLPLEVYRVLRQGLYLSFVQQSNDFAQQLLYSYYHRDFFGQVDFKEPLTPVAIKQKKKDPIFGDTYTPHFFVKYRLDGYNLGITVPDWWWATVKSDCPKPHSEELDNPTGTVDLVIAVIPSREFDIYWEYQGQKPIQDKSAWTRIEEQRSKFGWSIVEHPDVPEVAIDWPQHIGHKYFQVKHRAI